MPVSRWHHTPLPSNGQLTPAANTSLRRLDQVLNDAVMYDDAPQTIVGFNVNGFGAPGLGLADEGPALQAAFTAAGVTGGIVLVPTGTYLTAQTLTIPSNVIVRGMGASSIIKLKASANVTVISSTSTSNVGLQDLVIDGNKANNASGVGCAFVTVASFAVTRCTFQNCKDDGFTLNTQCSNGTFETCYFSSNGSRGWWSKASFRLTLTGCYALSNGFYGFDADAFTLDSQFLGCHAVSNTNNGFFAEENSSGLYFIGCIGKSNVTNGLNINQDTAGTLEKITVIGGEFYSNTLAGIRIRANVTTAVVQDVKILGADCFSNNQGGGTSAGIFVGAQTGGGILRDVRLVHNRCGDRAGTATQKYGIDIESTVGVGVTVEDNDTFGNVTAGMNGTPRLAVSGATPTVGQSREIVITQGGATTVTDCLGTNAGDWFVLRASDGNTTVQHNANVNLAGAVDYAMTAGGTLTLMDFNGTLVEIGRYSPSPNLTVGGTLSVSAAATFKGTLSVAGATILGSTLSVSSTATIGGTLSVAGAVVLASDLTVAGQLSVSAAATFKGAISVSATATFGSQAIFGVDLGTRFNNHTDGVGVAAGTLLNAPVAGNPAFWLPVSIAGTTRYIPCW